MAAQPARRALRFLAGFLALFFLASLATSFFGGGGLLSRESVVVLPLEGEISSSREFVEAATDLEREKNVGAVVVRIDSPGGAVAPSQEMYAALRRLRATKPVVASLGSVAASGGYYVASAADLVVANPGTLTGSIGVIMTLPDVSGLLAKFGVQANVLTAGQLKDMGSPFRPLGPNERKIFQEMADEVHAQFVEAVAVGRGMDLEAARKIADGRVMTGEQARAAGLVDELGGLTDAIQLAAARAGISGEPNVVQRDARRRPWWWRALFSEEASLPSPGSAGAFLLSLLRMTEETPQGPEPRLLWRLPVVTSGFR